MNFIHWHMPKSNFIDDYKLMGFFIHSFTVQILYAFPYHPGENILFIYKDQLLQLNLYVNFKISLHKFHCYSNVINRCIFTFFCLLMIRRILLLIQLCTCESVYFYHSPTFDFQMLFSKTCIQSIQLVSPFQTILNSLMFLVFT